MRNAPMDIPDPEPDYLQTNSRGKVYHCDPRTGSILCKMYTKCLLKNYHWHELHFNESPPLRGNCQLARKSTPALGGIHRLLISSSQGTQ